MAFCAIDFETYYDDDCSVKILGPEAYVRHPDFAILGVAIKAPGVLFSGAPEDAPWEKLQGLDFVAHNARFDQTVYNFFKKNSGVSAAPENPVWRCTADMAVYLRAGRSLKEAAFDLLGVTMSKDPRTKAKGKRILPGHPDYDNYMRYCMEDTLITYDLWDKFHDKWPEHEQEMSRLNRDQGALGIAIDTETLINDIANLQQLQLNAAQSIPWDWEVKKTPLSIVQIGLWCRKHKVQPPTSLAENDERFLEWEEQNREQVPWVKPLRDWRKINVLLRKLETIRDRVNGEGIMSYETKYFGAHTGRFSGGGGFNIQNLPRIPSFGVNLRGLIRPKPGNVFIIADFAQIEARILLWFAGDEATLQMARDGVNIYESHARATMGWTGGVLKKENPSLYSLAKARCLSGDTLILTSTGYKPISTISLDDLVWDGVEYVSHAGVQITGRGKTINVRGDQYTYDHELFISEKETQQAAGSLRGCASVVDRFRCAVSPGNEIWFLGSAILDVFKEAGLEAFLLSKVSLRVVRSRSLGFLPKLASRKNNLLRSLCQSLNTSTAGVDTMGQKAGQRRRYSVLPMGRYLSAMLRSALRFLPPVRRLWYSSTPIVYERGDLR